MKGLGENLSEASSRRTLRLHREWVENGERRVGIAEKNLEVAQLDLDNARRVLEGRRQDMARVEFELRRLEERGQ